MDVMLKSIFFGCLFGCLFASVVLAIGFSIRYHFSRSHAILQSWADRSSLVILHREYRRVFRGPFTGQAGNQTVYFVRVCDSEGRVMLGFVRCGSFFLGLWSDDAEVRWVE